MSSPFLRTPLSLPPAGRTSWPSLGPCPELMAPPSRAGGHPVVLALRGFLVLQPSLPRLPWVSPALWPRDVRGRS